MESGRIMKPWYSLRSMRRTAESDTLSADSNPKMLEQTMSRDEQFKQGLQMRKQVMGEAFVDKAFANVDSFTAPLQEFVTRNAWGTTWCREGLDLKMRSLITLSMLTALGRSSRNQGTCAGCDQQRCDRGGDTGGVAARRHLLRHATRHRRLPVGP